MSDTGVTGTKKRSKLGRALTNPTFWRGVVALVGFLVFWEVCSRMERWTGEFQVVEYQIAKSGQELAKIAKKGDSIVAVVGDYGSDFEVTEEVLKKWNASKPAMTWRNVVDLFVQQMSKNLKTVKVKIVENDNGIILRIQGAKPEKYTSSFTMNGKEVNGKIISEAFRISVPWIGKVPPPTEVVVAWSEVFFLPGYWESWYLSTGRVFAGFIIAQIIGIPFGLALAVNKYFRDIFFPPFEILRPIPPLAWVPASIVFWPTTEMSIAFVTFLGAFFTIVINVLGGARSIDVRYLRAAQSMGATQWDLFYRIILPGTLPSIFTGAAVGMGITWEVVLAGEMISGGGGQQASGGLGFFIWSSYMGGTVAQVIVGMISIGIAGYMSSSLIRIIGERSMPWRRLF